MEKLDWIEKNDAAILQMIESRSPPALVLIAGASCSGKTTFAEWLGKNLSKHAIILMDDYFRDHDDPELPPYGGIYPAFDMPEAYHLDELSDDLGRLLSGENVWTPIYQISENKRTGKLGIQ